MKKINYETCKGSRFTEGMVTFIVDASGKKKGEISLSVRVSESQTQSCYETFTIEVTDFVKRRANGEEIK